MYSKPFVKTKAGLFNKSDLQQLRDLSDKGNENERKSAGLSSCIRLVSIGNGGPGNEW